MSAQTTFKRVYRPVTKVINEVLSSGLLDFSGRSTNLDFSANQAQTFDSLSNIEHFIDGQIVVLSNRGTANVIISANLIVGNKAFEIKPDTASVLVYLISQNKFFDITSTSQIQEIQNAIGSLNGSIGALQSLTSVQSQEITNLKNRVQELEIDHNDSLFIKEKITIESQEQLSYIELQYNAVPATIIATVGRMAAHLGEDFTISLDNNKTRLNWISSFAQPSGAERIELEDIIFVNYKISNNVFNAAS